MKSLAALCVVLMISGWSCSSGEDPHPSVPKTHTRKIRVDTDTKKTKIAKVRASRQDSIEFTAEAGPVTIIIPTTDFEIVSSPGGAQDKIRDFTLLELDENDTATLYIPDGFPENRLDKDKDRHIWYLVICGTGADAYPGDDESPPRIIIRKR